MPANILLKKAQWADRLVDVASTYYEIMPPLIKFSRASPLSPF
jgi:hypothetical protein